MAEIVIFFVGMSALSAAIPTRNRRSRVAARVVSEERVDLIGQLSNFRWDL